MNIKEKGFAEVVKSIEAYENRLFSHPLHKSEQLEEIYAKYSEKVKASRCFSIFWYQLGFVITYVKSNLCM